MNKLTSMQCGNVTMLFMVVMLMDSGVGALLQGAQRGVEQHLSTGVIEDTQNAINLGETKNEQLPTATVVGETQIEQPHTPIVAQSHPTAAEFLSEHGDGQLDIASARKMEKKTQHATAKAKLTGSGCSGGGCGKAVSDEHDTSVNPDSASIDTKIETALSVVTEMWTGVGIGEATAMKVGVEQDVQHQDEGEAKQQHLHDDTHHKQDKKADGEAEEKKAEGVHGGPQAGLVCGVVFLLVGCVWFVGCCFLCQQPGEQNRQQQAGGLLGGVFAIIGIVLVTFQSGDDHGDDHATQPKAKAPAAPAWAGRDPSADSHYWELAAAVKAAKEKAEKAAKKAAAAAAWCWCCVGAVVGGVLLILSGVIAPQQQQAAGLFVIGAVLFVTGACTLNWIDQLGVELGKRLDEERQQAKLLELDVRGDLFWIGGHAFRSELHEEREAAAKEAAQAEEERKRKEKEAAQAEEERKRKEAKEHAQQQQP